METEHIAPQSEEPSWRQHFPTYHFSDRDVALEEYKFATKSLEADERLFLNAVNFVVLIGTALGSLLLSSLGRLTQALAPVVPELVTLGLILLLAVGFSILSLRYFSDRQRAVVFAARKVIVLRRMLGMSYRRLQLVLPNWRIEGADEPFAIRLFPGWNTYVAYPCYAIAGMTSTVAFFVLVALLKQLYAPGRVPPLRPLPLVLGLSVALFLALSWSYRRALLDTHERVGLLAAQRVARLLGLKLVRNVEYAVYRATLATHELHRLGVALSAAKALAVHIEDKTFYSHPGVSIRGLSRLVLSGFGRRPRSGGSTITQQLVRTLFIADRGKTVRRKIVEILLAFWFNDVCSKDAQLEMWLASVRFESGVLGIAAAMRHFLGGVSGSMTASQAFFLIERVSNIRSRLLVERVDEHLHKAVAAGLLDRAQALDAIGLYSNAGESGLIKDLKGDGVSRLQKAWSAA